ncbi:MULTISPECIES: hypothetical protein [Streptomyces]|nr:hypothetical protein [Streptomyces melanosporofaciens]
MSAATVSRVLNGTARR